MTIQPRVLCTSEGENNPNSTSRKWARKLGNRQARKMMKLQNKLRWGTNPIKTKHQAWSAIVEQKGLHQLQNAEVIFNKGRVTRQVAMAISDSGASGHFVLDHAPVINKKKAEYPIEIRLPDGKVIWSTHTANLDIPWLPSQVIE